MNTERLLKLADYLETVPTKRFDMGIWGSDPECETAGCAMGHACQITEFRDAGLNLQRDSYGFSPAFEGSVGYPAAARFFDIEYAAAIHLFSPDSYRTDKPRRTTVARCIREYVAKS